MRPRYAKVGDYRVVATPKPHENGKIYVVDFEIRKLRVDFNVPTGLVWEAELEGFVRFDGCTNWTVPGAMAHACDRAQLLRAGDALGEARRLAARIFDESGDELGFELPWIAKELDRGRGDLVAGGHSVTVRSFATVFCFADHSSSKTWEVEVSHGALNEVRGDAGAIRRVLWDKVVESLSAAGAPPLVVDMAWALIAEYGRRATGVDLEEGGRP